MNVLGMMSGTSMDGIDAVLARFEGVPGADFRWEVISRSSAEYPVDVRARLAAALVPETSNVRQLTELHAEVGEAYAALAAALVAEHDVDLIAMAGQTVYHIPRIEPEHEWRVKSTLQIGESTRVLERTGVPVANDFRQSDMSAGGEAAPMVSFGDWAMFRAQDAARAVHNLGGISNLTYLPADGDPGHVTAFDTGPASCILDEAMERWFDRPFDEGGAVAARGNVDPKVLDELMEHAYLALQPPKTTGREVFHLRESLARTHLGELDPDDAVATLTAFSAASIAQAYHRYVLPRGLDEVLAAGGGAHNPTLMRMIRERLDRNDVRVRTFEDVGWHAKDREALAFAVMGYQAWHGRTNTLPSATGARHAVVAGKIARPAIGAEDGSVPWRS